MSVDERRRRWRQARENADLVRRIAAEQGQSWDTLYVQIAAVVGWPVCGIA